MSENYAAAELRRVFDRTADRYQGARPEYPAALFDELIALAELTAESRLLEIGCATGKATLPLARRGFRITAVELGAELAATAKVNLAPYPRVTVEQGAFETRPDPGEPGYDLVFAATAWHWLDATVRYRRAFDLLRPGGRLAFWSATHVFPDGGDPFFTEIQQVYRAIGAAKPGDDRQPRPGQLPDQSAEIRASGLFENVAVREFDWVLDYTAEQYLALLNTFSGHLVMPDAARDRLHAEIRRRVDARPSGTVRRGWGAVLHVATRIPVDTDRGTAVQS
jgi:SAM-dependent methyltransferase